MKFSFSSLFVTAYTLIAGLSISLYAPKAEACSPPPPGVYSSIPETGGLLPSNAAVVFSGRAFSVNDFAPGVDQIQLRFTASDVGADTQSVVEAGVDAIVVSATECDDAAPCPADANADGVVNVGDLLLIIDNWGQAGGTGDINDDNIVNVSDLLMMIESWGTCP